MKKIIVFLLLLLTIFMQPASAEMFNDLDMKVNEYNENASHVPSLLKNMLGDEVIHLLIEMNDGSELHIKAVTEKALITTFEEIDSEDYIGATVKVTLEENAVQELLDSGNPVEAFLNAMKNKDINIEPVGLAGTIKFKVANILLNLSDILGLT
ncbi:hypothetical protein [Methanolobus halotolerans]|uniref:SCP-2 sterol transfer family protein n=1 Tax=Methanolobus halotolerans TaxID=2052935 RepID=A0A4E0PYV9_9EURY|nr:hypothetical protein [Methanolobus halotolerans]TGC11488.1 hypothetical protein CUN85_01040 [Methanolobus halotolerans]